MKRLILILMVFAVCHTSSYAQFTGPTDKFSIGWEVGIPSNDFISETSFRGGRIEYAHMVKPNLSIGIAGSWNSFQQYVPKTTYQKEGGVGAITSDIVKEVYSVPLTLNAKFYKVDAKKKLLPYLGIGLGAQYSAQAIYFNIYGIEDNNWGFVARPEIGVEFSLDEHAALYLAGSYNYASNSSDAFNSSNLSHFAITLGILFAQ